MSAPGCPPHHLPDGAPLPEHLHAEQRAGYRYQIGRDEPGNAFVWCEATRDAMETS